MEIESKQIKPDTVYRFKKSGNLVKTISLDSPYMGIPCWLVERTEGASKGKRMIVSADALLTIPV